jgi:hypothetical protein
MPSFSVLLLIELPLSTALGIALTSTTCRNKIVFLKQTLEKSTAGPFPTANDVQKEFYQSKTPFM